MDTNKDRIVEKLVSIIKEQEATIQELKNKHGLTIDEETPVQIRITEDGYFCGTYEVHRTYIISAELNKDRAMEQKALEIAVKKFGPNIDEIFFHEKYGWLVKMKPEPISITGQAKKSGERQDILEMKDPAVLC